MISKEKNELLKQYVKLRSDFEEATTAVEDRKQRYDDALLRQRDLERRVVELEAQLCFSEWDEYESPI